MTTAIITTRRRGARGHNMRILIAELQKREMPHYEIGYMLGKSPSALRKYINVLAPVIGIVRYEGNVPVYRITADDESLDKFVGGLGCALKVATPEPAYATVGPGRRFHIMADDAPYAVRINLASVTPDPWALPVEFFRSVGAGRGV